MTSRLPPALSLADLQPMLLTERKTIPREPVGTSDWTKIKRPGAVPPKRFAR